MSRRLLRHTLAPVAVALAVAVALPASAAPVGLDQHFGKHGVRTYEVGSRAVVSDVISAADGTALSAGEYWEDGLPRWFFLRTLADGSPDPAFGVNGVVEVTPYYGYFRHAVVAPDGRIIGVGGDRTTVVARFLPDGSPDPSFGSAGSTTLPQGLAPVVALTPDGHIVVAVDTTIYRLNADGTKDSTFGNNGTASTNPPRPDLVTSLVGPSQPPAWSGTAIDSLAIAPDGAVLAAGGTYTAADQQNMRMAVFKLTPSGSLDTSFGNVGGAYIAAGGAGGDSYAVAVALVNGSPVTADVFPNDSSGRPWLVKLTPNGVPDTSFGQNGAAYAVPDLGLPVAMVVSNGWIYGTFDNNAGVIGVSRSSVSGVVDTTFGHDGGLRYAGAPGTFATGLSLAGGRLTVAGGVGSGGNVQPLLVRFVVS